MTKRQLIDEIITINPTAQPGFLAGFQDAALGEYLTHLQVVKAPLLTGDAARYRKYFAKSPQRAPSAGNGERRQVAPPPAPPMSSVDDEPAQSCTLESKDSVAAAPPPAIGATTQTAAATAITLTDLPSSDDVADVVWQDDQPLAAGEAAITKESPSSQAPATADGLADVAMTPEADCDSSQYETDAPQTATVGQDDDGESQTQLAAVAAKLDVQRNETPFAGSSTETDSYLF